MANWTVSTSTTSTIEGSSVSDGSKVLTITPLTPYVLSAADFKIGGGATELPSGTWSGGNVDSTITKVVFADTGTAGTPSNTVTATVTFTSFTMPQGGKVLYIDIDEDVAVSHRLRYLCINSFHDAETDGSGINKHTVTYASAPTGITTTNNTPLIHNLGDSPPPVIHNHQGAVTEGPTYPGHQIFQVTFAANTLHGYYYAATPTYVLQASAHQSYYQVQDSNSVPDVNGNLASITYTVYYTPPVNVIGLDPDPYGDASGMCELGHDINFCHDLKQRPTGEPGSSPLITSVVTEATIIPQAGTSRQIAVIGFTQAIFKLVLTRTGDGHTYDFLTDTFTSAATTSTETTVGITGYQYFDVVIPAITSNTTYDITIVPTLPTSTSVGVPLVAGDLRLYQYIDVVITLDMLDGGSEYDDGSFPAPITITGKAGHTIGDGSSLRKAFSYTITEAMVTSIGSDSLVANTANNFVLDNEGTVTTLTDGAASSATYDVDSTTGIVVGNTINWSVDKTPLFDGENISELIIGEAGIAGTNVDNLTAGMVLSASNIKEQVIIRTVNSDSVTLSSPITTETSRPITFTAAGVGVSSVTNAKTLVASQSLNLTDNFSLTFGGQETDVEAHVSGATSTQSGDNVILAGFFVVDSFPVANATVNIDVDKLITIQTT
jgi:hypothetical protein